MTIPTERQGRRRADDKGADIDDGAGRSVLEPDVDLSARAEPAAPGQPQPDLERTGEALTADRVRSAALTTLAVLALLYTLYFARDFLIPIVLAVVLNFLLAPAIRAMARIHIAPPLGAAIVVLGLVGALGAAVYGLAGPAQRWMAEAPADMRRMEGKLRRIARPVQAVQATAEEVQKAAGAIGADTGAQSAPTQTVVVREGRSLTSRMFGTTEKIITALIEIIILLYFLLAAGDLFLQKLIKVLPGEEQRTRAVTVARRVESAVSQYLLTALFLNVAEGIVVGALLWAIGVPNAPLWAAVVALLEFIPYLGGATITVVLAIAGLTTFETIPRALMVPGVFVAVNLLWANLVWPMAQGRRLTLNPTAIFISLAFFWFLWGVAGVFLAVPILASFKILCDNLPSLAAVGEFLGERDEEERRRLVRVE
jgi:predicted PurR-regulated permease PerM